MHELAGGMYTWFGSMIAVGTAVSVVDEKPTCSPLALKSVHLTSYAATASDAEFKILKLYFGLPSAIMSMDASSKRVSVLAPPSVTGILAVASFAEDPVEVGSSWASRKLMRAFAGLENGFSISTNLANVFLGRCTDAQ